MRHQDRCTQTSPRHQEQPRMRWFDRHEFPQDVKDENPDASWIGRTDLLMRFLHSMYSP